MHKTNVVSAKEGQLAASENLLVRAISQFGVALIAINGLIGAGIFVLPAAAFESAGNFSPWLFVFCGVLMSTIILCFAQLAKLFEQTGGPTLYTYHVFGQHVAFQTTWLLYLGRATAFAANVNAFVWYISFLFPHLGVFPYDKLIILVVTSYLLLTNIFSVKSSMANLKILTVLKLLPLLVLIAVGSFSIDVGRVFEFDFEQINAPGSAVLLLVYAFIGFEGAVVTAGETKNPKSDIARALIKSLFFTTCFYFFIQSICMSLVNDLGNSKAPLSESAQQLFGPLGLTLLTVTAAASILGNMSAVMLTAPRMTYALAEEQSLPKWFAKISSDTQVPTNSILFFSLLVLILALTGSFIWLAVISSLARLLGFGICILALVKLYGKQDNNIWFLPLGRAVPLIALLICCGLAVQAELTTWYLTAGFVLVGSLMFKLSVNNWKK